MFRPTLSTLSPWRHCPIPFHILSCKVEISSLAPRRFARFCKMLLCSQLEKCQGAESLEHGLGKGGNFMRILDDIAFASRRAQAQAGKTYVWSIGFIIAVSRSPELDSTSDGATCTFTRMEAKGMFAARRPLFFRITWATSVDLKTSQHLHALCREQRSHK